jgi:hypothetical protein
MVVLEILALVVSAVALTLSVMTWNYARRRFKSFLAGEYAPKWALRHYGGDEYALENTGNGDAFNVEVKLPCEIDGSDTVHFDKIDAKAMRVFMAARTWGTPTDITVLWSEAPIGRERREWSSALPPKPPKR